MSTKTKNLKSVGIAALFAAAVVLGFLVLERVRPRPELVEAPTSATIVMQGKAMGSTYLLRYVAPIANPRATTASDSPSPVKVQAMVNQVLEQIDREISQWNPQSEISAFNAYRGQDWFPVTLSVAELIQSTIVLTEESKGRFDVTVGPLVDAWGFGPKGRVNQPPSEDVVSSLLAHVGVQKLEVRTAPPGLRKLDPALAIDLSSVGAGEALDRIALKLIELGVENFFLDVTGEIITHGVRGDGQPWRVAIARPEMGSRKTIVSFPLKDLSLATSGNYRSAIELAGRRYGHTLDATSGRPMQTDILSASVVDRSCRTADGLATALMTFSAEDALRLANERGWQVILLRAATDKRSREVPSSAVRHLAIDDDLEMLWSESADEILGPSAVGQ